MKPSLSSIVIIKSLSKYNFNHEIIPILNKIDLPASDVERTKRQIEDVIGIDTEKAVPCSGKTGEGIDEILEQIIQILPGPKGEKNEKLKKKIGLFSHALYRPKRSASVNTLSLCAGSFGNVTCLTGLLKMGTPNSF